MSNPGSNGDEGMAGNKRTLPGHLLAQYVGNAPFGIGGTGPLLGRNNPLQWSRCLGALCFVLEGLPILDRSAVKRHRRVHLRLQLGS